MSSLRTFSPVTDAELERARSDKAFRQKLLTENLDALLGRLQKLRATPAFAPASAKQMREGVELAVRLAELIQAGNDRPPRS